jgi:hypothetical protein
VRPPKVTSYEVTFYYHNRLWVRYIFPFDDPSLIACYNGRGAYGNIQSGHHQFSYRHRLLFNIQAFLLVLIHAGFCTNHRRAIPLCIVGEYIGAIYIQVMHRPLVIEKERINF